MGRQGPTEHLGGGPGPGRRKGFRSSLNRDAEYHVGLISPAVDWSDPSNLTPAVEVRHKRFLFLWAFMVGLVCCSASKKRRGFICIHFTLHCVPLDMVVTHRFARHMVCCSASIRTDFCFCVERPAGPPMMLHAM